MGGHHQWEVLSKFKNSEWAGCESGSFYLTLREKLRPTCKKIFFQIPRDRRLKTDVKKAITVLFLIANTLAIIADQLNKDRWTHRMGYYMNIKKSRFKIIFISEKAKHKKLYTLHAWNFMEENTHTHTHTHTHTQCVSIEKGLEWNTLKYQKEPFFGWRNYEYFYFFFYILWTFSFFFFFVYYLIPKNPFSKHALKSFNNVENAFYI